MLILQYAQSISDLQIQYMDATRNIINSVSTIQRNFLGNNYWKELVTLSPQYSQQIRNQSNEAINYFSRSAEIGNQVAIKSIDLARENIKNIAQAITSIQELNINLWNSWNSYLSRHNS
jgi:regulator of protease activity HflC (stomatin/prohibitin superfamily)